MRRAGLGRKKKQRKVFYPVKWVYGEDTPFKLAQVDTKDIYDKGTLGTMIWTHITRKHLPRYQWTFCEGRTRIRFLSFSRKLHLTNGLCFVALVMSWLRAFGIEEKVFWQETKGEEFGGDNPEKLRKLDATYYRPYGAVLGRAPKGRHGYRGRVERSLKNAMMRSSIFLHFSPSKMKMSFYTMHESDTMHESGYTGTMRKDRISVRAWRVNPHLKSSKSSIATCLINLLFYLPSSWMTFPLSGRLGVVTIY